MDLKILSGKTKVSYKKLAPFLGPGLLVSVGYMDPGNWATDIAGGSKFGYSLLSVVLISNIFAMLLQHLSLKLGIVTGRDLAQACRDHYPPVTNFILWLLCEIAIAACDLAEVIGSAIALNLLFGISLPWGIAITTLDVFLILLLQNRGYGVIQQIVAGLIFIIFACIFYETIAGKPELFPLLKGLVPSKEIVTNPSMLYIAIGILGATVMPHNLYLHSSVVQSRRYPQTPGGIKTAVKYATIDSTASLFVAFLINGAILVLAASAFHANGKFDVAGIEEAYYLLSPTLGTALASILFGVALLASGQSSTITGTIAGQIVMEGFLNIRLKPWLRRLVTRLVAVVPAFTVALWYGEKGTGELLVLSQIILSMQLGFAVVPLIIFTSSKQKMGVHANKLWLKIAVWIIAAIIISLNLYLLIASASDLF